MNFISNCRQNPDHSGLKLVHPFIFLITTHLFKRSTIYMNRKIFWVYKGEGIE